MTVGHQCLDKIRLNIGGHILVTKSNQSIPNLPFGNIWPIAGPREGPVEGPTGGPLRAGREAHSDPKRQAN